MLDLTNTLQQMNAHSIASAFRPVRCTEQQLAGKEAIEGFVYFTTDTKKIYCGTNGEYLPMGEILVFIMVLEHLVKMKAELLKLILLLLLIILMVEFYLS